MIRIYSHPLPTGVPIFADHWEADDLVTIVVSSSLSAQMAIVMLDDMLGRICRGIQERS